MNLQSAGRPSLGFCELRLVGMLAIGSGGVRLCRWRRIAGRLPGSESIVSIWIMKPLRSQSPGGHVRQVYASWFACSG